MSDFTKKFNLRSTIEAVLPRHFTYACGKLGPARTFLTLIHMRIFGQRGYRRVLNELKDGLATHLGWLWEDKPSSAAFCKARKKLTVEHCQTGFSAVYRACELARTHAEFLYKGLSIVAIDGTRLALPDSPELNRHFGRSNNQHGSAGVPMAGMVLMWNVSSQQPITFKLTPYKHSEPEVAQQLFDDLPQDSLLITDRGFPSYTIFADLIDRQQPFLVRVAKNHGKDVQNFANSASYDSVISYQRPRRVAQECPTAPENMSLRLLKVELPNGDVEILATNLLNQDEHIKDDLAQLYTTRWRIETAFREMKVWHALENFSAQHVLGIHQEVTAALVFALMVSELEAKIRIEKSELLVAEPTKPLPSIRYNRLMIADAVVGLLVAASAGPQQVQAHLQRSIEAIWRNREKRRQRPSTPRKRKRPAAGFKTGGKGRAKG